MTARMRVLLVAACTAIVAVGVAAPTAGATSPLSAYKTAEAKWTRTFEWTIEKTVDPSSWNLLTGQSGTSTYTVKVTKTPATESITVDGEVCVTNIGQVPTENLKIVDRLQALVGDDVTTLASVPLDMSLNPVLDPGESQCYPYSIPFTPVEGATYRNNARITITNDPRDPGEEMGPNEKVDFTLPPPTVVNGSVNVDDTNGMSWLFNDSGTVTYTKTFTCDRDEGKHDNTATIRETGQSDDASVTVACTPPADGCSLTQGYWKTHSKYGPAPYDSTWAVIGEDTTFFLSGKTWYQAINTSSAGGNAYYILAQQYIAARLNIAAGTGSTAEVNAALASATAFFSTYAPSAELSKSLRAQVIGWAETLADYNEGDIGPGHCPD
ncbi:MAG TPA: hypothetical protein VD704_11605 [Gaiellaceae bacterium]|nr:hypothetical protein [Gaiellaceae bacterium]